jgi:hypothetical protein
MSALLMIMRVPYSYFRLVVEPWSLPSITWTFLFSLIVLVSTVGNCIVLWIVTGNWRNLKQK